MGVPVLYRIQSCQYGLVQCFSGRILSGCDIDTISFHRLCGGAMVFKKYMSVFGAVFIEIYHNILSI